MSGATRSLILLFPLLLLAAVPAAGQRTATLTLQVVSHETQEPLVGAQVRVLVRSLGGVADATGTARITGIPAGSHVVEVRHIGYATERMVVSFQAGENVEGEVELVTEPISLDPVEVRGQRLNPALAATGFYERQKYYGATYLDRTRIEALAGTAIRTSALMEKLPGVRLVRSPKGMGYAVHSIRGSCAAQVWVDGVPVSPEGTGVRSGRSMTMRWSGPNLDDLLTLNMLEAVEWYHGPATTPPEFNLTGNRAASGVCGTLVIWTRRGA